MKATRPLEYLCFTSFPLPAKLDGSLWAFIAIDIFNKKEYLLDMTPSKDKNAFLENLQMLLEDSDFLSDQNGVFTLILEEEVSEFGTDINRLLKQKGGTCVFNTELVKKELNRILDELNAAFHRK